MLTPTILIVDDEPGVRTALSGVLRDEEYTVEAVSSGEECLERVMRGPVDLIVLTSGCRAWTAWRRWRGCASARSMRRSCCISGHGLHRVGGPRRSTGRVRFRREAALGTSTRPMSRRAQRAAAAAPRGGEPRAARPRRSSPDDDRREQRDAAAARAGRDGRAHQRPRAHLRRRNVGTGKELVARTVHALSRLADRGGRRGELRGDSRRADRARKPLGHVRARVHRRRRGSARQVRSRRRRDDLPR